MTRELKTKWFKLSFTFKHRWVKIKKNDLINDYDNWKTKQEYRLGLLFKPYKAIGKYKGSVEETFSNHNLITCWRFKIDLLLFYVSFDYTPSKIMGF